MTLPTLRIPIHTEYDEYEDEKHSLLPLSTPSSPGRTARRLTIGLRLRASRYYVPLLLISVCLTGLYFFTSPSGRSHGFQGTSRFHLKSHDSLHLPSRNLAGAHPNGVSLLLQGEDELIAEDDLFGDKEPDHQPLSDDEKAAEAELQAHKLDVLAQNRMGSLRALIWWIAEGGVFPADWEIPSKNYLKKVGARGMERLLEDIDSGTDEEAIFEDGWADFAKRRYRIVVFSKSYCPYSLKAKGILEQYRLTPAPFVIELDQRPDTHTIQTLLDHLTGRRTVPNVIFDFVPIGGADDTMLLHSEGGLSRQFKEMGVIPGSTRKPALVDEALPEDIPPPEVAEEQLAPAVNVPPKDPQDAPKDAPFAPKKGKAPAPEANAKPVMPPKKPMEKAAANPEAPAQEVFHAPAKEQPAPVAAESDEEVEEEEKASPVETAHTEEDEDIAAPSAEPIADDSVDAENDGGDDDDEPVLSPPSEVASEVEDELETPAASEDEEDLMDAPSAYVWDADDEDDDEPTVKIPVGATPAEIKAAIQAAHGDEYLYVSDDDGSFDVEDAGFVGDKEMLRNDQTPEELLPPPPPKPVKKKKVEAAAEKIMKAGAEKIGAAIKAKVAEAKEGVKAAGKQKVEAAAEDRKPAIKAVGKKLDAPAPKKAAAAPPRNKVEAVAQKKAQAAEAIAEKKAEVAPPPKEKMEAVLPPKKKAAAPKVEAAAGKAAAAPRRKAMDKVDARELLKPAAQKDVAPAKKDTDAKVAGGKKAFKLPQQPAKKDEDAAAARPNNGGKGSKPKREPIVEVDMKKKGEMAKKDVEGDAKAAKREKLVEKAGVAKPRKAGRADAKRAPVAKAAKRKGKVL